MEKKWIDACGRNDDWFPTQNGVICSSHFDEKCFQPIAKSRRLFPTAVPTLKLRLVFETPSSTSKDLRDGNKTIIKPSKIRNILKRNEIQIEKYKKGMLQQKMHIKRLQMMVRRYHKKAEVMKNILKALRNENAINGEHLWLLESDGLSSSK